MRSVAFSARKREFSASISLTAHRSPLTARRFELLTGVPLRSSRTQLASVLDEMPSLIAQAATPSIGALLIQGFGTEGMLGAVTLVALLNVGLVGVLFLRVGAARRQAAGLPIA